MKKIVLYTIISGLLFSCKNQENSKPVSVEIKSDQIYQYSVFTALANKIYDGKVTVGEVKEKGDLGLGTYNGLNGEMIVLDGTFYQFPANGIVRKPGDEELVPFSVLTFYEEDKKLELPDVANYQDLKSAIEKALPSQNAGYALKIEAEFRTIKCGSANKQEKPFSKTLSDALVDRPTFDYENVSGTMVGFWYPEYIGKINVPGFHLHFISENKKMAGHVIEFQAKNVNVGIDVCDGFDIELPQTRAFDVADFDLSQEYSNKK